MGWEKRNGRLYFYEKKFIDGERVRICHGWGLPAKEAEARIANDRKANADDIALIRAYQLRDQRIDRKVTEFAKLANRAIQHQLIPHGYHWTNGRWRKQRVPQTTNMISSALTIFNEPHPDLAELEQASQETEMLGDEVRRLTLEALHDLPKSNKDKEAYVTLKCKVEQTVGEVQTKVDQLRRELQYEEANIFDRLLIEQLLSAWVQWYVASWLLNGELPMNRTWRQNQYYERRYQLCHTRYAKAIDQLTKVRQLPPGCFHLETQAERDARDERLRELKIKFAAEKAIGDQEEQDEMEHEEDEE